MTTFKDFPKLEDWSYKDLLAFYNNAIQWKIEIEKELGKVALYRNGVLTVKLKEILG